MIVCVEVTAWKCTECGWEWFPKKNTGRPSRCPKRECRKGADYGVGEAEGISKAADMPTVSGFAVRDTGGARGSLSDPQSKSGTVGGGIPKDSGRERKGKAKGGGMTAEEFFRLGPTERMRATREGKYKG